MLDRLDWLLVRVRLLLVARRRERLRRLAPVTVERDGLETEFPSLVVDGCDLFDGCFVRNIDGFGNRPSDIGFSRVDGFSLDD